VEPEVKQKELAQFWVLLPFEENLIFPWWARAPGISYHFRGLFAFLGGLLVWFPFKPASQSILPFASISKKASLSSFLIFLPIFFPIFLPYIILSEGKIIF
jgi:hypothetical protein